MMICPGSPGMRISWRIGCWGCIKRTNQTGTSGICLSVSATRSLSFAAGSGIRRTCLCLFSMAWISPATACNELVLDWVRSLLTRCLASSVLDSISAFTAPRALCKMMPLASSIPNSSTALIRQRIRTLRERYFIIASESCRHLCLVLYESFVHRQAHQLSDVTHPQFLFHPQRIVRDRFLR